MADEFELQSKVPGLDSVGHRMYIVTPGAGELPFIPRTLLWLTPGTATIEDYYGTSTPIPTQSAGFTIPGRVRKVTAATASILAIC